MLWAKAYPAYFKALITSWRAQWNEPDAPFLFVQIAGHDPMQDPHPQPNQVGAWAAQRLAQATALELPHTAMATAADAGDSVRVHTRDKKTVGTRLALAGLALAYGKDIPYRGPRVKSTRMEQDKVVLDLDTDGVALKSVPAVTGFELAGADGVFHAATATLKGNSVTVSSPEVTAPAQVRYAFADLPYLSVYDTNGLPLPPFGQTVEPK
jgi:sialate O-acetylesterase